MKLSRYKVSWFLRPHICGCSSLRFYASNYKHVFLICAACMSCLNRTLAVDFSALSRVVHIDFLTGRRLVVSVPENLDELGSSIFTLFFSQNI